MQVHLTYFSGVSNTTYLSALFEGALATAGHTVRRNSLDRLPADWSLPGCDLFGFGALVYHAAPPEITLDFLNRLSGSDTPLFTFWSKGLYAGNCARIFQQAAVERGFRPVANFEAIFPGVDFAMQMRENSRLNRWFNLRMTKDLPSKISDFVAGLSPNLPLRIEPPRWYAPLNNIARARAIPIYEGYKRQLHALPGRCAQCNLCVDRCPQNAIHPTKSAVEFDPARCILCLRCYHHCSNQAIPIGAVSNRGHYAGPQEARNYVPVPAG